MKTTRNNQTPPAVAQAGMVRKKARTGEADLDAEYERLWNSVSESTRAEVQKYELQIRSTAEFLQKMAAVVLADKNRAVLTSEDAHTLAAKHGLVFQLEGQRVGPPEFEKLCRQLFSAVPRLMTKNSIVLGIASGTGTDPELLLGFARPSPDAAVTTTASSGADRVQKSIG